MSLDLDAIRNRAALARSIAHGPNALWRALASADDVPTLLAEIQRLTFEYKLWSDRIAAVEQVLDEALGPNEENGTGQGVAADVALLAQKWQEAEADRDQLRAEVGRLSNVRPTYDELLASHAQLLEDRDERTNIIKEMGAENEQLITKAERHRVEIRDARNDLLDVRGILSPNGDEPVTPLPLVPTVAPAVQWLVNELARLRAELPWVAAEDTATIQPCQPIGCDNGYHLAGCQFAEIDAAEPNGTEAGR